MKPLPRLLALTDDRVAQMSDLDARATALVGLGPALALVARIPGGTADALATLALRLRALANASMAQLFVTGRTDVAAAVDSSGVILRRHDLRPSDVRSITGARTVIVSVHSEAEAQQAIDDGADGLLVGTIWPSTSHPGRAGAGVELLRRVASLGLPIWAIGGVTAARAREARAVGAWGVAAISAVWDAADPGQAAAALVAPWSTG